MSELLQIQRKRLPEWFKIKRPSNKYPEVKDIIKENKLHTICEEARCPNLSECWSHGTATFLILGDTCTRWCSYCNVKTGMPKFTDLSEPLKVADAVSRLKLKYVVITSVTRDDLSDGGALIYSRTISEIRKSAPECSIEVLIPDFKIMEGRGGEVLRDGYLNIDAIKAVVNAKPDVLSHNIETVRGVFKKVRPGGNYDESLELLKRVKSLNPSMPTKSGVMAGLGESLEELYSTFQDLISADVDFLSIGQYLQPSPIHAPIERFYTPAEFDMLKQKAASLGFIHVESGPLVRSSYRADKLNSHINKL